MKFIIECEMNDRWVKHFLAMLKQMEYQGRIGHSGKVGIFADGDGDFRPKFKYNENLPSDGIPIINTNDEYLYDAG